MFFAFSDKSSLTQVKSNKKYIALHKSHVLMFDIRYLEPRWRGHSACRVIFTSLPNKFHYPPPILKDISA